MIALGYIEGELPGLRPKAWQSCRAAASLYKTQSSANRRKFAWTEEEMSLINKRKYTGPRTEPRGTLETAGLDKERIQFTETFCVRSDKKASSLRNREERQQK